MTDEAEHVVVVGAGTMGHGIAQVAAMAGRRVTLVDVKDEFVQRGIERIHANLAKGVEKGKVDPAVADAAKARVSGATELAGAVADAAFVVEAVPERLDLKREAFRTVEAHAPAHCVMATNTSSLSIAAIAESVQDAGRVVGMHFFNPVHLMQLVEVVKGPATAPTVVTSTVELAKAMGKEPIVVHDVPGFASSRLGVTIGLEAIRMVQDGVASAEDIDKAMTLGYRHPMGPLRLTDLVGLDVRLHIAEYLARELGPRFEPPELLRKMVAEGKLGQKSGEGFYRWD